MFRRPVGQQRQFVPPLAEAQEQRQQDGAGQQPVADRYPDHQSARHGAQHETHRNRHHVEDDEVLEPAGICHLQRHVRCGRPTERRLKPERRRQAAAHEDRGPDQRRTDRQRAGGDRPPRFQRVLPIGREIRDVVEEIDGSGQRAKNQKGRQRERDGGRVEQTARENERRENDEVLGPLTGPERDEHAHHRGPPLHLRNSSGRLLPQSRTSRTPSAAW